MAEPTPSDFYHLIQMETTDKGDDAWEQSFFFGLKDLPHPEGSMAYEVLVGELLQAACHRILASAPPGFFVFLLPGFILPSCLQAAWFNFTRRRLTTLKNGSDSYPDGSGVFLATK